VLLKLIRFQLKTTVRMVGAVVGIPAVAVPFLTSLFSTETAGATKHPFLSEEWIEAARKIREEYRDRPTQTPPPIRINHIVTGVPFGDGTIEAHTDTTKGDLEMDLGHLEGADLTVTLAYDVAKKILVDADMQAAMQAFMSGQIKVEGDMSKLMALQTAQVDPIALEAGARIREITS
jgi:SCP-2 sterol transfer family protein